MSNDDISLISVPARHRARRVSSDNVQGQELLRAILKSAFGTERSKTHWLAERFVCQGPTAEVARVMAHLRQPFSFPVIVCRNQFKPKPPKELKKLRGVMHRQAQRLYNEPNAGGSSEQSEAVSFAMIKLLFGASLEATEMSIEYEVFNCKKIDYLARLTSEDGSADRLLGVSVTRAYRHNGHFDSGDARELLCKKLRGLWIARRAVSSKHAWHVSILHVWCESDVALSLLADELTSSDVLTNIWPLRLFSLASSMAPVILLTAASTVIDHVIFRMMIGQRSRLEERGLSANERHVLKRQHLLQPDKLNIPD